MSTIEGEETFGIGARLREERARLDWSQEQVAECVGTSGRTIKKYESEVTMIGATELRRFGDAGADVLYIVTGRHQPVDLAHPATAAQRLAAAIASLKLTDADAEQILAMARRLAGL